eukprot:5350058-Pleurochrysis_carterae.AAC.1
MYKVVGKRLLARSTRLVIRAQGLLDVVNVQIGVKNVLESVRLGVRRDHAKHRRVQQEDDAIEVREGALDASK